VDVKYALACLASIVDYNTIVRVQVLAESNSIGHQQKLSKQLAVLLRGFV
jgi:hypothetical protein